MMMMMRPNAFIHSFERERERKRGKSLVSRRGLSSPHANENKKETKRGARFFVVVVVVVVDAKTLVVVVLLKRQKRESVWSQRHKETHFFHLGALRDDFSTKSHRVQRRNKVSRLLFTFAFGTDELLLVSEKPSSSFPSSSSKVVVIVGDFNKGQKRLLYYVAVGVRANSLSLSLSLQTHTQIRERKVKKK